MFEVMQNLTNQYGKLFYIIHDIKFKGNLHFFKIRQKKKEKKKMTPETLCFQLEELTDFASPMRTIFVV